MTKNFDRRRFMGAALATSAVTVVPRHVLGGPGYVAPGDKLTLAHIGMGTQGFKELGDLLADPKIQIVAVCDPNQDGTDYVEWGKGGVKRTICNILGNPTWREGQEGCPGGREVGREVIDTYYAKNREQENFKACAAYADFRDLLESEKDVDAVKVMTPDHLHATISIAAMKKGMHVFMHKPIANRMHEGRLVLKTARKTGVATHLLAYGSGIGNGRIAERILKGLIGPLREIHNWTNRPVWPQYPELPTDTPPVPAGFDWDLWLGPCVDRPYHPHYTHTVFRGWYDFGGGSMADMGIYSLWPVFRTLGLKPPVSAEAWATHTCKIEDGVSRGVKNDYSYPIGCSLRFHFEEQGQTPGIDLFWYDGGMKPRLPSEVEVHDVTMGREGILFVGDDGAVLAGFHGQDPKLFAGGKVTPLVLDDKETRHVAPAKRYSPWLAECLGGEQSPGSYLNTAAITDTVNLGTVALRAGRKIEFDSKNMKITNFPGANKYLVRKYRQGWEL